MMPVMEVSLPGTTEEASSTVSPGLSLIWCVWLAMRPSAAIGSPWEPVEISAILSSGMSCSFLKSTTRPLGILR